MKYHALLVIFEKAVKFENSSAANYRWRFKGKFSRQSILGVGIYFLLITTSCQYANTDISLPVLILIRTRVVAAIKQFCDIFLGFQEKTSSVTQA